MLIDDLNTAHQVALNETQNIANLLHGLLQVREEEATAKLHATAQHLHQALVRKV